MPNKKISRWDLVAEFLEAYFHSILAWRDVYPETIFKPRRKYGTIVQECTNDQVRDYIAKSLKGMSSLAKERCLRKACLVVTEEDDRGDVVPVEKFVVEICPDAKSGYGGGGASSSSSAAGLVDENDPLFARLEQEFRAVLLKAPRQLPASNGCGSRTKRVRGKIDDDDDDDEEGRGPSETRSFQIWTVVDNQGAARFLSNDSEQHDFPWITLDRQTAGNDRGDVTARGLAPFRRMDTPVGCIHFFALVDPHE